MTTPFALVGPGRVGCSISKRLVQRGYPLTAVVGTSLAATEDACRFIGCDRHVATTDLRAAATAPLILLAVPDDAIAPVARQLQAQTPLTAATVLLHFSGVHTGSIMRHGHSPAALGSLHPLLPFADRQLAFTQLPIASFTTEGDQSAVALATAIVRELGARIWVIAGQHKPLYHAACCMASNYLVTLVNEASRMLTRCGVAADEGVELLTPLLTATLKNLVDYGPHQGLTGPIVRGDTGTIKRHLDALLHTAARGDSGPLLLYCTLGRQTVELAEEAGHLDADTARDITALLRQVAREDQSPESTEKQKKNQFVVE